jgi:apolipoprotein D and lipocalin family protein
MGLSSCATRSMPPVEPRVDLERYQGVWHEAARLPMTFQKGCQQSTAEYRLKSDGKVAVTNRCLRDGRTEEVKGTASVLDPPAGAKLEVRFDTWFGPFIPRSAEGNYWILDVSPGYTHALVGTPNRKNLWILARRLPLEPRAFSELVEKARRLGYPVEKLIVDPSQTGEASTR